MSKHITTDELWDFAPVAGRVFQPDQVSSLPSAARRYLEHAIAPATPLATAVRLKMQGEIKLKEWLPFTAEQVIRQDRGMIWSATVRMHGLPIVGADRLLDGAGEMKWKLFGIIPMMTASGPDITRSAVGRVATETIWLPSALCGEDVTWTAAGSNCAHAHFEVQGETAEVDLAVDDAGRPTAVHTSRWGNPEGAVFHYGEFGGVFEEEGTFNGYTIPTRVRVGWYFGTDRFESEGEFFRATIVEASYR